MVRSAKDSEEQDNRRCGNRLRTHSEREEMREYGKGFPNVVCWYHSYPIREFGKQFAQTSPSSQMNAKEREKQEREREEREKEGREREEREKKERIDRRMVCGGYRE